MVDLGRQIRAAGSVQADDDKALEHATQAMETLLEVIAAEGAPPPSAAPGSDTAMRQKSG